MTDYQRKAIICDARNFRAKAQNRVATSVLQSLADSSVPWRAATR